MDHVIETKRIFKQTLQQTMHQIAIDTYNKEPQPEKYSEVLDQAYEKYFRSMKGATNINHEDVHKLIQAESQRQKKLHDNIESLKPQFENIKTLDPTDLYAHPYWDHGLSYGVNIQINNAIFYIVPRVPCSTTEYATLKQAPIPANIILINTDIILMLPHREEPSKKTLKRLTQLTHTSDKIKEEEISETIHVRKNFLWTNSNKKIDEQIINKIMKKNKADAFMVGYPVKNIAIIYTGLEKSIESLWKTMYFDWDKMWRRYGWYE
jgi:hypothetical protein